MMALALRFPFVRACLSELYTTFNIGEKERNSAGG